MSKKPSRSRSRETKNNVWPSPSPAMIRKLRGELTQEAAGVLVKSSRRTWQEWEAGRRRMPAGLWELATLRLP